MIDEVQLTSYVKQPTLQYSSDAFVETYKCKTSTGFALMASLKKGETYAETVAKVSPIDGDITGSPASKQGFKWILDSASLEEQQAGENSLLRLQFALQEDQTDDEKKWFVKNVDLQWKPYSMSIYGFCANEPDHTDKNVNQPVEAGEMNQTSISEHIKAYTSNPNRLQLSSDNFGYFRDGASAYRLNVHETAIAKKINMGKEYVYYSTPVMTIVEETAILSTNWKNDFPSDTNVAEEIDCIANLPTDAIPLVKPIWAKTGKTWEWKNSQDQIQCVFTDNKNRDLHIWRRTRVYEGGIDIDKNFYGTDQPGTLSGRWQVATM